MKEQDWQTKKRIETDYATSMMKLSKFFFSKAIEDAGSYDEQLSALHAASASPVFKEYAYALARRMITGLKVVGERTWREAASAGMQSSVIYKMLSTEMHGVTGAKVRELVQRNADLISSLPLDVAKRTNAFIQQESMKGKRYEEISQLLGTQNIVKKLTKTRIALIARTETSKASTALTRVRSEDIGADWYVWRTSKDARVRTAHNLMDKVLVAWSESPAPETLAGIKSKLGHYHAGDAPNCRCYPQTVLSLNEVKWPARVYHSGSIQYMTRSKFEQMFSIQKAA